MKFSLLNDRNLKDKATSIPGLIAVVALALAEYEGPYPHSETIRPWASLIAFLAGAVFAANTTSGGKTPTTPKGDA